MASVSSTGSAFPMITNRVYKGSIDEDELDEEQFPLPPPPAPSSSSIPSRHRFPSSPSYENSREEFIDQPLHQYEDMNRLAAQVKLHGRTPSQRPRKKNNEIYERVPKSETNSSFKKSSHSYSTSASSDSCDSGNGESSKMFWRMVIIIAILLALAALIASLLVALGVVAPHCACVKEIGPVQDKVVASPTQSETLLETVKQLQTNITDVYLMLKGRDATIANLKRSNNQQQKQIEKLQGRPIVIDSKHEYKYNFSTLRGPRGPIGPTGPRGEKGEQGAVGARGPKGSQGMGNLTQCTYHLMESTPFTADEQGSGSDVVLLEPRGHKVFGVTCSSKGTSEYNLESTINSAFGDRQYKCICRGKSRYFPHGGPSDGTARCYLHYWICPVFS